MRVFVADTLVRLAAEHAVREAPLPRVSLPRGDGSVLGVAREALQAVQTHPDDLVHWGTALDVLALAELVTLREQTYAPPPPAEAAAPAEADAAVNGEAPADAPADTPTPTPAPAPAPPSQAAAQWHAARAVHCAPWHAAPRRTLAAAHGPI